MPNSMLPECPIAAIGNVLDAPECGHFAVRLGSRHPWTPALIYLPCPWVEVDPYADYPRPEDWFDPIGKPAGPLRAKIGEREVENTKIILCLWQGARGITVQEYMYLMARRQWARRYDPNSYHSRPVDLSVLRNRELL
jgi:hypothetical protein